MQNIFIFYKQPEFSFKHTIIAFSGCGFDTVLENSCILVILRDLLSATAD